MTNQSKTMKVELQISEFSRSPVDILIPFHGQYDAVTKLIKSILHATKSNPYQITLIDDGSPNAIFIEEMKGVPQVKCLRHENRKGMTAALKTGYDNTQLPWVVFMNSDCEIMDGGWLIEMGRSLLALKGKNVRMVAPKIDSPSLGCEKQKCTNFTPDSDYILENSEFLPFNCVMFHRQLFSHTGGFLKNYNLLYQDEEFNYRMKKYGFKQAICGKSWIKHSNGLTLEALYKKSSSLYKKLVEEDYAKASRDLS